MNWQYEDGRIFWNNEDGELMSGDDFCHIRKWRDRYRFYLCEFML